MFGTVGARLRSTRRHVFTIQSIMYEFSWNSADGLPARVYSPDHEDAAEFGVLARILVCDSNKKCGIVGKVACDVLRTVTAEQAMIEEKKSFLLFKKFTIRQDWPDFAILS